MFHARVNLAVFAASVHDLLNYFSYLSAVGQNLSLIWENIVITQEREEHRVGVRKAVKTVEPCLQKHKVDLFHHNLSATPVRNLKFTDVFS
jgi:hypothetical protein